MISTWAALEGFGNGGDSILSNYETGAGPQESLERKVAGAELHAQTRALLLVGGDGLGTLRKSCSKDEASGVVVESLFFLVEQECRTDVREPERGKTTGAND